MDHIFDHVLLENNESPFWVGLDDYTELPTTLRVNRHVALDFDMHCLTQALPGVSAHAHPQ